MSPDEFKKTNDWKRDLAWVALVVLTFTSIYAVSALAVFLLLR